MHIVRALLFTILSFSITLPLGAQPKFRVAWESIVPGCKGHDRWTSEDAAFSTADYDNEMAPALRYWVEKRRRFLFIPLQPQRALPERAGIFNDTTALKNGDKVVYRLPGTRKMRKGIINGIIGEYVLVVNGKRINISSVAKLYPRS